MGTCNVQQPFARKQCFSIAYKLIAELLQLKGCWPPLKDLERDPRIISLLKDLDKWVDYLYAKEGGL